MDLKWTKQLPKKDGHYWVNLIDPTCGSSCGVEVVEVSGTKDKDATYCWINGQRFLMVHDARGEDGETIDNCWESWEWAGPIPEPKITKGIII